VSEHGRKEGERERESAREKSFIPVNRCAQPARLGGGMGAYRTNHNMPTAGQEWRISSLSPCKEARTTMKKVRNVCFGHSLTVLETDKAKEE
jgi:hypothetical protein